MNYVSLIAAAVTLMLFYILVVILLWIFFSHVTQKLFILSVHIKIHAQFNLVSCVITCTTLDILVTILDIHYL